MALPMAMHYCGVYFQTLCCQPPLKKFKPKKDSSKKLSEPDGNKNKQSSEFESIQEEDVGDELNATTTTEATEEPAGSKSASSGEHQQATESPTQTDSQEGKNSCQNRRTNLKSSGTLEDTDVTVDPEVTTLIFKFFCLINENL